MEKKAGSFRFVAATIILVFVAAVSFAGTAMCRTDLNGAELEGYYGEKERQLVRDTRQELERRGFCNSGVTLTRVLEGDGKRKYTVTVHHREIDRMEAVEREALAKELSLFAFEDDGCSFRYEFLITLQPREDL